MTRYWTAIQIISMKVFRTHEIPHMSLQIIQIYSCAKTPGTGHEMRIQFYNWFCEAVSRGEVYPVLNHFTNEAWFYLSSLVNPQNTSCWLADNPRIIYAVLLHDVKVGVWSAISVTRIIRHISFLDKINLESLTFQIPTPFFKVPTMRKWNMEARSKIVQPTVHCRN